MNDSGKNTLERDVIHRNLVGLISISQYKDDSIKFFGCEWIGRWELLNRELEEDRLRLADHPVSVQRFT